MKKAQKPYGKTQLTGKMKATEALLQRMADSELPDNVKSALREAKGLVAIAASLWGEKRNENNSD
jgi:hypothetical protein